MTSSASTETQTANESLHWLPSLAVVKALSLSVLQCQCASSDGRMRVRVARTQLGQLSSVNKLICLDFQGYFFSNLSTSELTKTRTQLNFRLTEYPQFKPVQWEDEVLAVSGRKVLILCRDFQEWEIFLWFIFVAMVIFVYCSSKIEAFLQHHSTKSSPSS